MLVSVHIYGFIHLIAVTQHLKDFANKISMPVVSNDNIQIKIHMIKKNVILTLIT